MSIMKAFAHGLRSLVSREQADQDADDEVDHFLEQAIAEKIARGQTPAEARRSATLEIGGALQAREHVRTSGWENIVLTTMSDLRFAARRLISAPGFTVVALITLGLGIGGTTAIFSAVNSILFDSLPYANADRVVAIQELQTDGSKTDGSWGMYHFMAQRTRAFESMAVIRGWQPAVTGSGKPERLEGQRVSAAFFDVLGVRPAIGAGFDEADDRAGGRLVAMISDGLWRRRFGADPTIVGQPVRLDDVAYTVVGVLPENFRNVLSPASSIYTLLQYDLSEGRAWGHHLQTIGRLRDNITTDAAARELNAIGPSILNEQKPATYSNDVRWVAPSLQSQLTGSVRTVLLTVLAAVGVVLLIACVNVTNLLLARGVQRRGEFALRAALGAGRVRIVRQLLTESLLLSVVGGVVATGVALAGIRALAVLAPTSLPRATEIHINMTSFLFAFAITVIVGIVCGLMPAMQASSNEYERLQESSRRTAGEPQRRTRRALVIAEVSLAVVLMVASGLLLRSLQRVLADPIGFDPANTITMQIQASSARYADDPAAQQFFNSVADAARAVPGVTSAGFTSQLPLSGDFDTYGIHFESAPVTRKDDGSAFRYAVTPGYLETMGIGVQRGRSILDTDRADTPPIALIGDGYAKRVFGDRNPIGEKLRIGPADGVPYTIVGVVSDVKQMSLTIAPASGVYIPETQSAFADRVMTLVVRTRGGQDRSAALRSAIWSVDPDQAIGRVATMHQLVQNAAAERRFALTLFEAFAVTALMLAAAGLYGVLSGSVAERTREIGVRSALGATRTDVLGMVVREGLGLAGIGIVVGVAGAVGTTRIIHAMLFAVSPLDAVTYAAVITLLLGVACVACALPAFRAMRVDPSITLRSD